MGNGNVPMRRWNECAGKKGLEWVQRQRVWVVLVLRRKALSLWLLKREKEDDEEEEEEEEG
jgi:hypothetical protein